MYIQIKLFSIEQQQEHKELHKLFETALNGAVRVKASAKAVLCR